mgnify:CR=1 FL=1
MFPILPNPSFPFGNEGQRKSPRPRSVTAGLAATPRIPVGADLRVGLREAPFVWAPALFP